MKTRRLIIKIVSALLLSGVTWALVDSLNWQGEMRFILPDIAAQFVAAATALLVFPDEFGLPPSKSNIYAARLVIVFLATLGASFTILPFLL